jgi:D-alanyl-lipoteichoic acid acyltransferase DltB (MBOAT superfamily)
LGAAIFWNAQYAFSADSPILLGWAGMVGVVLMLHFGLFKLLSCDWRAVGVEARPLMVAPLAASSITEFWGKRWNTAFRDFAHQILFRPLARRSGASTALFLTFLFSGLIHDIVISVPAGGGYGGPTAFFVVQPVAMVVERSSVGRRLRFGSGWRGWMFAAAVLIMPAGLLFHSCFIHAVVIPFMRALGAA